MWQPNIDLQNLQIRAKILQKIRNFFIDKNILEVQTPILSQFAVTDLHLHSFSTKFIDGANNQTLYLITSPEYHMKRLLASGAGAIFQITPVFRNGEQGAKHNPEFTMLEWYRPDFSMDDLIAEIGEFLQNVFDFPALKKISYQEVFKQILKFDPLEINAQELAKIAKNYGLQTDKLENRDLYLEFLFSYCIEPKIAQTTPVAVFDFPASQAALAKLDQNDPRVAKRFEIYFKGLELANGFNELTDPLEQQKRFKLDNQLRKQQNLTQMQIDNNFIDALKQGLPNCSGVAIGLDRLFMLYLNQKNIKNVLTFDISNC